MENMIYILIIGAVVSIAVDFIKSVFNNNDKKSHFLNLNS